tara:strand:- start:152 stop:466 length:315 start_codon:yes stop_codon:yes gene_type:complete
MLNSPAIGLIGQLLDTEIDAKVVSQCTVCEMADIIKSKSMASLLVAGLDPDLSVEIDGEKWDRPKIVQSLKDLYDWADDACTRSQDGGAAVVISPGASCKRESC